MKKVLVLGAALALYATSAFAVGIDFNFVACPGGAGSTQDWTVDCAGGETVLGLCTFMPAEALPDLVALDTIIDFQVPGGDVNTTANFWNFESQNSGALGCNRARPSSGCTAYANIWNIAGSGEGYGSLVRSPSQVRIAAGAYRPSNFANTANQKIFGYQLTIDASTSVESTFGTATGCTLPVVWAINQGLVGSANNLPTTLLTGPSMNASPCSHINGDATPCAAVPTVRNSWSRLKSLYR